MRTVSVLVIVLSVLLPVEGAFAQIPPTTASRLSELVAAVETTNPELAAAQREIDMRAARVRPAGAPPDPIVSAGFMGGFTSIPFFPSSSNASAFREFSISQELPYPGKLRLRSQIAATDTDVARTTATDLRLERVAEFKEMYVEYRFFDRSLAIIRRNRVRLQQMTRVSEALFAVGEGAQPDVVKAQLELSLLTERETAIERQQAVLRARLNQLLNRPPQEPISPALTFDVAELPEDIQELQRRAEEFYPALKRDEQVITRNQQALALAKKEILPDFGARLNFQKYAAGMPWMYGVEFMMNIPIFADRKQRPMVAEATASLTTSEKMREATRAAAFARIGDQFAVVASSRRLVRLYEDSVLPQARLALEASMAAYETGSVDFLTLLSNFTTILDYELALEEQHATWYRALANLEPLVGTTFLN
jgi:outer membrane protein, heavy metal efflux system